MSKVNDDERGCLWPISSFTELARWYCGEPRAEGSPWCARHAGCVTEMAAAPKRCRPGNIYEASGRDRGR